MSKINQKNSAYWRKRFEQLEESQLNKSDEIYQEIKHQYQIALSNIEKDIIMWYSRFALNNGISMAEVNKLLNSKELAELKWTVDEYIKYGKENAINQMWIKELENASAKVHITRLEAIKLQIQNHLEVLYSKEVENIESTMKKIYADGYYNTAFEISKGIGVATNLAKLDNNTIDKVIRKPWTSDGINFSERIWGKHRPQLIYELHKQLTQTIIGGKDPQYAINAISEKFDVSKRQAGNLIMTESAFFASQSKKDCFEDLDVEEYEIVSTLDLKTSSTCRELDGKVFDMKNYEVGITAPPFHNFCRTTTAPYFEDEEEYGTRVARDADGNVYTVPSNMKYNEWYDKYVKGNPKEELLEKKLKNQSSDKKQHKEYLEVLKDMVPKSFEKFQDLKYNRIDNWKQLQENFKIVDMYKVDFGYVSPEKIIELDKLAFSTKKASFDYSKFSGKNKKKVKQLSTGGNFAIMEFEDKQYFSHSSVNLAESIEYESISNNKLDFILHKNNREFETLIIDEIPRHFCTEAKMFEFLNDNIDKDYDKSITILSELDMCDSCRGVLEQFKQKYSNTKINIISGKDGINWRKRK